MNSIDAPRLDQDVAALLAYWAGSLPADGIQAHFGVPGHPRARHFLALLQELGEGRLEGMGAQLLALAAEDGLLQPLDRVSQCVYKILTWLPLDQTRTAVGALVAAVLTRHPGNLQAEHMALEFMLYFGLLEQAASLLAMLPAERHLPLRAALRRAQSRLAGFTPRTRVSYCILTWNRADLLDACLTDLRAKIQGQDYEIIVGVNASTDHTGAVLERHGIQQVRWNVRNDSIDFYREIMDAATGEYIVEVDDNVVEFPVGFDQLLIQHLQAFPDVGYLGFEPTRWSMGTGAKAPMSLGHQVYFPYRAGGLEIQIGPVWGCCAMLANRSYRAINGLYGARLSKDVGEEPQFIRKLLAHGLKSGLLMGHGLVKAYP